MVKMQFLIFFPLKIANELKYEIFVRGYRSAYIA